MSLNVSNDRWRIIHRKATLTVTIGYVEAPDEDSAIDRALGKFKLNPRVSGKLIAEKAGDR
jgi:hypothetical protein